MAQVDLIDGRVMLQGPLPAKDWSFAVAGRRSWIDLWLKPVLDSAGSTVTAAPALLRLSADHRSLEDFDVEVQFASLPDPTTNSASSLPIRPRRIPRLAAR